MLLSAAWALAFSSAAARCTIKSFASSLTADVCITGEQGQLVLQIHYGSQVLELARGKTAVEVTDTKALVTTLQVVHTAVMAGEQDTQIESAANTLKSRF